MTLHPFQLQRITSSRRLRTPREILNGMKQPGHNRNDVRGSVFPL